VRFRSALESAAQVGIVVAAVAALGLAAHQPWLFPTLGPTAVLQAQSPRRANARPWNAIVGHGCGVLFGWLSVVVLGAQHAPPVLASGHLTAIRLAAATATMVCLVLSMALLRATHAPAAATALLFAEGSYRPSGHDVLLVLAGVALTVATGEALTRARRERTESMTRGTGMAPSSG
jgi:HPP family